MKLGDVKVNKLHLGGGFGRRGQQDYTRQAVLIAKQVPGRPVKLIWSREEDITARLLPADHAVQTARADWMRTATSLRCMHVCPASPSWPISCRRAWRTASTASHVPELD